MTTKLWFVTNGVQLIGVFKTKDEAEQKLSRYSDDPDFDYYSAYSLSYDELEDSPEEFDLAQDEGFID